MNTTSTKKHYWRQLALLAVGLSLLAACGQATDTKGNTETTAGSTIADPYQPKPYVQVKHPEWSKNAVIYQINTRQFTPEGTFAAAQQQLPRLKALGVDILWLMPI